MYWYLLVYPLVMLRIFSPSLAEKMTTSRSSYRLVREATRSPLGDSVGENVWMPSFLNPICFP